MTNEELLAQALSPQSDTLGGDDLVTGPRTITITEVHVKKGHERPLIIRFEGDEGKPWKPCKTTGRTLANLWGGDFAKWAGRSVTLFRDPDVIYGGAKVGGIRVQAASHIGGPTEVGERLNGKQIKMRKIKQIVPVDQPTPKPDRALNLTETLIDRVRTEDLDAFEADAKVIEQRAWLARNRPELSAQVDAAILEAATLEGAE